MLIQSNCILSKPTIQSLSPCFTFLLQPFSCTPHIIERYTFPDILIEPGVHDWNKGLHNSWALRTALGKFGLHNATWKWLLECTDMKYIDEKIIFKAVLCFCVKHRRGSNQSMETSLESFVQFQIFLALCRSLYLLMSYWTHMLCFHCMVWLWVELRTHFFGNSIFRFSLQIVPPWCRQDSSYTSLELYLIQFHVKNKYID